MSRRARRARFLAARARAFELGISFPADGDLDALPRALEEMRALPEVERLTIICAAAGIPPSAAARSIRRGRLTLALALRLYVVRLRSSAVVAFQTWRLRRAWLRALASGAETRPLPRVLDSSLPRSVRFGREPE